MVNFIKRIEVQTTTPIHYAEFYMCGLELGLGF